MIEFKFGSDLKQQFIVGNDIVVDIYYNYVADKMYMDFESEHITYSPIEVTKDTNLFQGFPDLGVLFITSEADESFDSDTILSEHNQFYIYYMDKDEALENGVPI